MFKLTLLIKAHNLIVIDCAIDFILQVFNSSDAFFTIISNALNRVAIDQWGISIHYTFRRQQATALCVCCSIFKVKQGTSCATGGGLGVVVSGSRSTHQNLMQFIECVVLPGSHTCRGAMHQHSVWSPGSCARIQMRALQRRARSIRETAVTFTDCD